MNTSKDLKVTVAGAGYVGLSIAVLISQSHNVSVVDIDPRKVELLNNKVSPIKDKYISDYLSTKNLRFNATIDGKAAYRDADFIVIATPTNYDSVKNSFDTSSVEAAISLAIDSNPNATIVIKSTVPVGYTLDMREKFHYKNILFSPEFLREGNALYDNLYPSRIIVGTDVADKKMIEAAQVFAQLLSEGAEKQDIQTLIMGYTEAEAVKLFANTYLALRVGFFNELDTYAELNRLNSSDIINGVCLDPRIGAHYNNPSFGYGGYCLPKDTKQLLANYKNVPQNIIEAIVKSNKTRKAVVSERIIEKVNCGCRKPVIGIYRLIMKSGSDNFRQSAIWGVIENLQEKGADILVYEPTINSPEFNGLKIEDSFSKFVDKCDIIVANRLTSQLEICKSKVYTRDIFSRD